MFARDCQTTTSTTLFSVFLPPLSSLSSSLPLSLISMIEYPLPSFVCCLAGSVNTQSISKPTAATCKHHQSPTISCYSFPLKTCTASGYFLHEAGLVPLVQRAGGCGLTSKEKDRGLVEFLSNHAAPLLCSLPSNPPHCF